MHARRGWLGSDNVLDTLPLATLRHRLAATMGRWMPVRSGIRIAPARLPGG